MSPHSGLSRIKGKKTGGRGPPAKDVSAHSGLEHKPIASAKSYPYASHRVREERLAGTLIDGIPHRLEALSMNDKEESFRL